MKKNSLILPEGYRKIVTVFIVSFFLLFFVYDCFGYWGMLLGFFLMYAYRNTYRHIHQNTDSVLAPIDSTVTAIDKVNGKYKIYCKVSLCNNHVFRAPVKSELKMKKYKCGLNLNPNTYKASLYNEQIVLKFDDIKIKLLSGVYNHKMKRFKEVEVSQGDSLGVFLNGIVVITVASSNNLLVDIGDKLTSGQTVLFKK